MQQGRTFAEKNMNDHITIGAIMAQQAQMAYDIPPSDHDLWLKQMEELRVSFLKEYPADQYMLEYKDTGFFARGDIHGIKAKQKSGKTNAIAIMAAALLSGQCMQLRCPVMNPKILIFDTEQKPADTRQLYGTVFALAQKAEQDLYDRLQVFTLRRLGWQEMMTFVKQTVHENHPDIVFIDGLVDLLTNFNEIDCSMQLLKELMVISTDENCAVVGVLHTNKALDDHNMRGHLGTLLSQKSGTVLECVKKDGVFYVTCSDSRHAPVADWCFAFDQDGHLFDASKWQEDRRKAMADVHAARKQAEADAKWNKIKNMIGEGIKKSELAQQIADTLKVTRQTAYKWLEAYEEQGKARVAMDSRLVAFVYINNESDKATTATQGDPQLPF